MPTKSKRKDAGELLALALRSYAKRMLDAPDQYSKEEGQELDRALRSCKGISDIDVVWIRWIFVGQPRGWVTSEELRHGRQGYYYPL